MSLARTWIRGQLERGASLSPQLRQACCIRIADSVGIALAAADSPLATQISAALSQGSTGGPCGLLGRRQTVSAGVAAFTNSALIHLLDFDDIHDQARLHPTTVTLPAALAAAQLCGASGQQVVDAVLLGDEMMCRLGIACAPIGSGPGSDWFLTQLFGYFGGALAAALVMDMDEDAIVSALGLAYMQAAGGKQAGFGVGSNARSIYPAFAAMGAVQACLLAQAGISGPEGSLDGDAGLFPVYLGAQATTEQRQLLLDASHWQVSRIELKPWPCCRISHPYVAAALNLRPQLAGQAMTRIEVHVNASAAKLCRPLPQRQRPTTLQDATYSIPWMTAFTLVHGRVDLQVLGVAALSDERVLRLAQLMEVLETLPDRPGHPPARLRVHAQGGRSWDSAEGIERLADGMDERAAADKFQACLAHAGHAPEVRQALWDRLRCLHQAPQLDFLFSIPAPP